MQGNKTGVRGQAAAGQRGFHGLPYSRLLGNNNQTPNCQWTMDTFTRDQGTQYIATHCPHILERDRSQQGTKQHTGDCLASSWSH